MAAAVDQRRDVLANLNYWPEGGEGYVVIDFKKPEERARYAALDNQHDKHAVQIQDVRGEESKYTLEENGFQYVQHEVPELDDWTTEERVKEVLIPKTEEFVRDLLGADKVVTFTHRIRCLSSDENQLANNRAPANAVHSDFTREGALHWLQSTIKDAAEVEGRLSRGKVLIVNSWRPLKEVRRDPLAVCDWTSTIPGRDQVRLRMDLPTGGWSELGKYVYNHEHRWRYLSHQKPNELLLFKQFDSTKDEQGGCTLAHSAFVDPGQDDSGEPRQSIEIKMFVFISN